MALVSSTSSLGGLAGGNALARLLVVISGDSSQLEKAVAKAQGTLSGFQKNMSSIGGALTKAVTLPILAAGGAATYMAVQFQASMGRVAGLTPILDQTGQSIEDLSNQILQMSREVPTGPIELANALYFAGSAGLKASVAMQAVELSAKGAAIGMGEASDISKVLIFALNNYGSAGLTATQAMDALTVAIREGTAEPDEMAVALGRLLPVAKEAGVTFQEVVGSIAALTNVGFPARVATTSLRALFAELLAPTQQATERLKTLGLEAQDLRNVMQFAGPIAAFQLLEKATRGDEDALRDVLPQIRGFSAYLALTDDEMKRSKHIFKATTDSAGALGKAFDIISKTPGFKFAIALNKLKVAAIDVGSKLIPVLNKLSAVVGDIADRIGDLPDPLQKALIGFLGLAAALGPVLKLMGVLGVTTGQMFKGFAGVTSGILTMGLAAFAAYGGMKSLLDGSTSLFSVIVTLVGSTVALGLAFKGLESAALAGAFGAGRLSEMLVALGGAALPVAAGLGAILTLTVYLIGQSDRLGRAVNQMGEALLQGSKSGETLKESLQGIRDSGVREELMGIAKSMGLLDEVTSRAIPRLQVGVGDKLVGSLQQINQLLPETATVTTVSSQEFAAYTKTVLQAVAANADLGPSFKKTGKDGAKFLKMLEEIQSQAFGTPLGDLAKEAEQLTLDYPHLIEEQKKYNDSQLAAIAATQANSQQLEEWARRLHLGAGGADYLASRLQQYGIAAVGANEKVFQSFKLAAEGPNLVSLRTQKMEEEINTAVGEINDTIEGGFGGFDKLKDKVKKTSEQLLRIFQTNTASIVTEVGNLRDLAERGVPLDVLGFLADKPQILQKFVDASGGQLRRLTALYASQLAATDDEILAEVAHQEDKGKSMVMKFTSGILSNDSLPPAAAAKIVNATVAEFGAGRIKDAGLSLALRFAQGLGTVQGLSKQQGARALAAFIDELEKRDLTKYGYREGVQIANGIAKATGISKSKAEELVMKSADTATTASQSLGPYAGKILAQKYSEGILTDKPKAESAGNELANAAKKGPLAAVSAAWAAGARFGSGFANAIGLNNDAARTAGKLLGEAARKGLEEGLKNSPKYFSFYAGQEVSKQFEEGIDSRRFRYPIGSFTHGRIANRDAHRRMNVDVDVTLDRGNVAREVDWDWRVNR